MLRDSIQNLAVVTPPASEPVSLATAKQHLRVTFTNDDALISCLISSARQKVEKDIRRALVTRSYELRLNRFPPTFAMAYLPAYSDERAPAGTYAMIRLPKPPLISIDSVTYVDVNGVTQTLDPSAYLVDAEGVLQGSITPAFGTYWPQARYQLSAVRIGYTAGFGDPADVPAAICQAMLLLIGGWYRNREPVSDLKFTLMPLAYQALLSPFLWGAYG